MPQASHHSGKPLIADVMFNMLNLVSNVFIGLVFITFGSIAVAEGNVELEKIEEDGVIAWINKTSEPDILGVSS